jgi:[acyl-carrier-protein] S-malonyltransferase
LARFLQDNPLNNRFQRTIVMSNAFLFPGQGSQQVGMGKALAESFAPAKAVFDEVNEALSQDLSKLMWDGPEDELTLTENAQPALMAVSLAAMRSLEEKGVTLEKAATYVAGHSLGEYSALAASGALSIADAARLLKTRGRAMQEAVPVGEGAMAALLGAELPQAKELAQAAAEGDVCEVANDNAPGQVVISGAKAAIDRAIKLAPEYGARRAVPLPVSAPFHCSLMGPAADAMREAIAGIEIKAPCVPLVANVLAEPISDPEEIRKRLVEQVTGSVRWRESMLFLQAKGIKAVYEVGAGRVLTGIARRFEGIDAKSVGTAEEVEAVAAELAG